MHKVYTNRPDHFFFYTVKMAADYCNFPIETIVVDKDTEATAEFKAKKGSGPGPKKPPAEPAKTFNAPEKADAAPAKEEPTKKKAPAKKKKAAPKKAAPKKAARRRVTAKNVVKKKAAKKA